jgi:hypothetical protein
MRLKPGRKISHVFIIVIVFLTMLIPWTLRNAVCLGRFSVASDQSDVALLLNDHRLPLYAQQPYLQNAFNMSALQKEYVAKYPDERDRAKAIRRDFLRNTLSDPVWLSKAAFWRSLGFYGLLPPGVFDPNGPRPTDWSKNWQAYIFRGFYALFFISISILGIWRRPQRLTIFLAFAIISNLVLVLIAPMRETRYGFPVLPLHLVLGLFVFFRAWENESGAEGKITEPTGRRWYIWIMALFMAAATLMMCRLMVGQNNAYRKLMEKAIVINTNVELARDLPSLNSYYLWLMTKQGKAPHWADGERVRLVCRVTDDMLPPKSAGAVPYLPEFASDPLREVYYYAFPYFDAQPAGIGITGVSYFGATCDRELKEGNIVDIEGVVMSDLKNDTLPGLDYWIKAEKIRYVKENMYR